MRRYLAPVLGSLLVVVLSTAPGHAVTPDGFACGPDQGREHLTTAGFHLEFTAPAVTAPELAATREQTGDGITRQRSAHFFFQADFVPYTSGDLAMNLSWPDAGEDFDLYVLDDTGEVIGASDAQNLTDTTFEATTIPEISNCTNFSVEVRNWSGTPNEPLTLDIKFQNPGPTFACGQSDPAPGCAGKAAGAPPSATPDTREHLYLSSDGPGQLTMAQPYAFGAAGEEPPMHAVVSKDRPVGGQTNSYTHTVFGFPDQQQNPFHAAWALSFEHPVRIQGDVSVLVWVSSETFQQGGGKLFVDLFADGAQGATGSVAHQEIPGEQIGTIATPIFVTFHGLDLEVDQRLVVQVGSNPVATSGGNVGNPADAQWTVYYGSVQFQSGITIPAPQAI